MSVYSIVRDELSNDPLSRGYAGMTAEQVISDLNTAYRTVNVTNLSGQELFQATDPAEFAALPDLKKDLWVSFTSGGGIDPFHNTNIQFVTHIFGSGTQTLSNLASIRTKNISRAEELSIVGVKRHHIDHVRGL